MSKFVSYVKEHIPETVCVSIVLLLFAGMTLAAIILYHSETKDYVNTFDNVTQKVDVTQVKNAETAEDTSSSDAVYYVVGSRIKYHSADCYFVKDKDNSREITLGQIEKEGYEPCTRCIE